MALFSPDTSVGPLHPWQFHHLLRLRVKGQRASGPQLLSTPLEPSQQRPPVGGSGCLRRAESWRSEDHCGGQPPSLAPTVQCVGLLCRKGAWWEFGNLGSGFSTGWSCDLGRVPCPLWFSVSSSVKKRVGHRAETDALLADRSVHGWFGAEHLKVRPAFPMRSISCRFHHGRHLCSCSLLLPSPGAWERS